MKFLRDPAHQGASLFIAMIALLLQFPQYLFMLLPVCVLLLLSIYIGNKLQPTIDGADVIENQGERIPLFNKLLIRIKKWWSGTVTVIVIAVALFVTVRQGVMLLISNPEWCPPIYSSSWSEKFETKIYESQSTYYLRSYVANDRLLSVAKCLDPKIEIINFNNDFTAVISFEGRAVYFEDAGYDPENQILEPVGHYTYSYDEYLETYSTYPFQVNHTYFLSIENSLIRIHVYRFFDAGDLSRKLSMYVSYVPNNKDRFQNLTKPWYCLSSFNTCNE